jgi:hypothetical protein
MIVTVTEAGFAELPADEVEEIFRRIRSVASTQGRAEGDLR